MTACVLLAAAQIGGVFRNTLSRTKKRDDGTWEVAEAPLSAADRAEVDARLKYAIGDISQ